MDSDHIRSFLHQNDSKLKRQHYSALSRLDLFKHCEDGLQTHLFFQTEKISDSQSLPCLLCLLLIRLLFMVKIMEIFKSWEPGHDESRTDGAFRSEVWHSSRVRTRGVEHHQDMLLLLQEWFEVNFCDLSHIRLSVCPGSYWW